MKDSISTPGMGALGIVRALQGRKPAQEKTGKKKKKNSRRKNGKRKK